MNFFKRLAPKSLYGRFLLIIIASFAIVQLVSIYVFYYTHLDVVSKHMARGVIEEMIFIKRSIKKPGYEKLLQDLSENTGINFSLKSKKTISISKKIADSKKNQDFFSKYFSPLIDPYNRFKIELEAYKLTPYQIFKNHDNKDLITVEIQTAKGVLSFEVPIKRIASSTAYVFTFWMCLTAIIMALIAIIFFKNQMRSLKKLTVAAEKFGKGQEVFHLDISGSQEMRSLASSFVKMQERIKNQIAQRTETLSAVSHDLRTPLTRMKLQIAIMEDKNLSIEPQILSELQEDIKDMQMLIDEYLDFSIIDNQEKSVSIAINQFLLNIINAYKKNNFNIEENISINQNKFITIKQIALKRALVNLIDNACKYGNKIIFSAEISGNNLMIAIEDNGKGIPLQEQENVFRPFYRIDNARNLDQVIFGQNKKNSGAGLGMAIAMDSISLHGGKIKLGTSFLGGLKVLISIPF
jgi:two-component system osmolarity sensor histidine kinase EnvZ